MICAGQALIYWTTMDVALEAAELNGPQFGPRLDQVTIKMVLYPHVLQCSRGFTCRSLKRYACQDEWSERDQRTETLLTYGVGRRD